MVKFKGDKPPKWYPRDERRNTYLRVPSVEFGDTDMLLMLLMDQPSMSPASAGSPTRPGRPGSIA